MMNQFTGKRILIGYLWNLAVKFGIRGMGVISTLILVRILTPGDFGIAISVTIILGFLEALTQVGSDAYIQTKKNLSNDDINTAWSIKLTIRLLISLIILIGASGFSQLLNVPELEYLLLLAALIPIFQGLVSPGFIILHRELNFKTTGKVDLLSKLITTISTILLALSGFSYWSLIIGSVIGVLVNCAGSYFIHTYRPKFTLIKLKEQWHFSKWITLSSITGYLRSKVETLFITRTFGAATLGYYSLAQEFSSLAATELLSPIVQPLISGLATAKDKAEDYLMKYFMIAYLIIIPAAVGNLSIANNFVLVVFGEQWLQMIPLFQALSFLMPTMVTYTGCRAFMIARHNVKFLSYFDVLIILMILIPFILDVFSDIQMFVLYRVLAGYVYLLLLIIFMRYKFGFSLKAWVAITIIPFLSSLIMYFSILMLFSSLELSVMQTLISQIFVGGVIYIVAFLLLLVLLKDKHYLYGYLWKNMNVLLDRLNTNNRGFK